jgi:hypothetical protein
MARHVDLMSLLSAQQMSQANAQGAINQEKLEFIMAIAFAVFVPMYYLFAALVVAGVGKLISFFVGAENGFKAIFSVALFTMIAIKIIEAALLILLLYVRGPGQVSMQNANSIIASNLGAILGSLFGEDILPKFFMKLAEAVDAFAIWDIALLSIGYAAVSRKLKVGTVAIWLSALYGILALLGATISSMFSPK